MTRSALLHLWLRRASIGALAGLLGLPAGARADEIDPLGTKVAELDKRLREYDTQLRLPSEPGPELAERRLIDAQVLYALKNYEEASIVLFDVVEKFPDSPAYPESLFYLADSLYQKRDYLSARRYFERVVGLGADRPRYGEALERLIELSLHTGDYEPVDGYISKLEGLAVKRPLPSVPYVEGKYFYFRKQYERARKILATIGPTHPYYLHGLYFIGSSLAAEGPARYDEALIPFSTILKEIAALEEAHKKTPKTAPEPTSSQRLIAELSHMALGRLHLELGQLIRAAEEYDHISQKSDQLSDALYESAWVAIKAHDYPAARRKLDLMLLNAPDSPLAPEVKLLIGSLHIRKEEYEPASASFTKTRDEFEPIHRTLDEELKRPSTSSTYFRDLIQKNLMRFDMETILPQGAGRWVKGEPEIARVATLVNDEAELTKTLNESVDLIKRLERALSGASRINIFPDLARVRSRVTNLVDELSKVRQKLADQQTELLDSVAGDRRAELEQVSKERKRLEGFLELVPSKAASVQEREAKVRSVLNELDKRATELLVELSTQQKLIDALRKSYAEGGAPAEAPKTGAAPATSKSQEGLGGNPVERAQSLGQRLTDGKGTVDRTREQLQALKDGVMQKSADSKQKLESVAVEVDAERLAVEQVRRDLLDAMGTIGLDDSDVKEAERVRAEYEQLLVRLSTLSGEFKGRLGGAERAKVERIEQIFDTARALDARIATFNGRIDTMLEAKIAELKVTLAEEKAHVAQYLMVLGGYTGESAEVGGAVVADSFKTVERRFYNIVVRADVGIIDVAWALKDSSTHENTRLIAERKRELKLIDDEFKEALKEQP